MGADDPGAWASESPGGPACGDRSRHELRRADRGRKRAGRADHSGGPFGRESAAGELGTEATMSAIRLARGFTGRDVIIKFAGNYHGHVDSLLVAAGSAAATLGVPNSPGVTGGTARD